MPAKKLTPNQLRTLGFLPLAFFTAQAIHYWQIHQLEHMLWMCNIGNLLLAFGLFLEQPILIRVAVMWMLPGIAVWLVYVVPTWGMLLTGNFRLSELYGVFSSSLAHVGGFSIGIVVLRTVRMDSRAWFYAFIWYLIVQLLSRLVTPVAMNVNLSQKIQDGWEQTFSSYWKFWLVLTLVVALGGWLVCLILARLWPSSPPIADRIC